ncbi:hypothetical protein GCM10010411_18150 [Actinomadura fulvescens]|uniref:Uncharacterized protein n=1 Tax=Actinomadura fulvescens TaxID=46160 RepID=A0ABN3PK80_9ACTN
MGLAGAGFAEHRDEVSAGARLGGQVAQCVEFPCPHHRDGCGVVDSVQVGIHFSTGPQAFVPDKRDRDAKALGPDGIVGPGGVA